jgi:uncharacterized protein (UPF0276 family)
MSINTKPRLGLPNLGLGVGLRNKHFNYLLNNPAGVDWFEIISENFMDDFGFASHVLMHVRKQVPVVMHGVSLSVGSTDPINYVYLQKLKALADIVEPEWISDHLCWTGVAYTNTHDLLPMPMTEESLDHVAERVLKIQDFLKRPLILENPSTYLQFKASTMPEWEFLSALAKETGCGLLLDVNNVFVSAHNHGFDAVKYIDSLPDEHIVQMHIAGPTDCGALLVDTHDQPVPSEVWKLYRQAQQLTGGVSTLLEWDAKIPEYPELLEELFKAREVLKGNIPDTGIYRSPNMPVSNPVDFQLQASNG